MYKSELSRIEQGEVNNFVAEILKSHEDLNEFFKEANRAFGYKEGDELEAAVQRDKESDEESYTSHFAVKKEGHILAGGDVDIEFFGHKYVAFFSNRFVKMEYRGKGLSHLINEARIKYAEQSKCDEAYCFVLKNNPRAIRLALQDGFSVRTIRQRPSNKPERNNAYYAKIDLQRKRNEFSKEDVEDAVFIQTGKNTILPKVLVSIEDQKLCDELLEKGYEIRWLIMAEDKIKNISQPTFYLEKI